MAVPKKKKSFKGAPDADATSKTTKQDKEKASLKAKKVSPNKPSQMTKSLTGSQRPQVVSKDAKDQGAAPQGEKDMNPLEEEFKEPKPKEK